ncbi:MAG: sigma-70 family RNA polymerase sigma factor [Oscillospiraceae bacterium]|nr:sigma-70 family RNA polymerase sigma factor [Oscillospiraceae bacterium]
MSQFTVPGDLVRRAQDGDSSAFAALYDLSHSHVYSLALHYTGNGHDAADVVQDSYVEMMKHIADLRDPGAFPSWLCTITANRAKKLLDRQARRQNNIRDDGKPDAFDEAAFEAQGEFLPAQALEDRQTGEQIVAMVDRLPLAQREVILAFYYNEQSVADIAAATGAPAGTVKARLYYARESLRKSARELMEKGVVFTVAPLPILTVLLDRAAQAHALSPAAAAQIYQAAVHQAGVAAGGGAGAGSTAVHGATADTAVGEAAVNGAGDRVAGDRGAGDHGAGDRVAGDLGISDSAAGRTRNTRRRGFWGWPVRALGAVLALAVCAAAVTLFPPTRRFLPMEAGVSATETAGTDDRAVLQTTATDSLTAPPEETQTNSDPAATGDSGTGSPGGGASSAVHSTTAATTAAPVPGGTAEALLNAAPLSPMKTENAETDAQVAAILGTGTPYERLKRGYDWIINNVVYAQSYVNTVGYSPFPDYVLMFGISALETKQGVCDNQSALFVIMARAIGFEAYTMGGQVSKVGGGYTGHAWAIIRLNGTRYVFDPDVEHDVKGSGPIRYLFFCKTQAQMGSTYQWQTTEADCAFNTQTRPNTAAADFTAGTPAGLTAAIQSAVFAPRTDTPYQSASQSRAYKIAIPVLLVMDLPWGSDSWSEYPASQVPANAVTLAKNLIVANAAAGGLSLTAAGIQLTTYHTEAVLSYNNAVLTVQSNPCIQFTAGGRTGEVYPFSGEVGWY